MPVQQPLAIFSLAISWRTTTQAHSLSNAGALGNRVLSRTQLLANNVEVDAWSANIIKHHHAVLTMRRLVELGSPICEACARMDGRRAAALVNTPDADTLSSKDIIAHCGLCDIHGFLVPGKNATADGTTSKRDRMAKPSAVQFAYALALPDQHAESLQVIARTGHPQHGGQMLITAPVRSGVYGQCMRYNAFEIGLDMDYYQYSVTDDRERARRHTAVLTALQEQILNPQGARVATALPHVCDVEGVIAVCSRIGVAPVWSPLKDDFVACVQRCAKASTQVFPFQTSDAFWETMEFLLERSYPALFTRMTNEGAQQHARF